MFQITPVVKSLLILNIGFFLVTMVLGQGASNALALYYFQSENFRFYQIATHFFMHAGFMHIFFNMYALVMFGSYVEKLWGGKKFLFYYIFCALGAAILHTAYTYYHISGMQELAVAFRDMPDANTFTKFLGKANLDFLTTEGKNLVSNLESALRKSTNGEAVQQAYSIMQELIGMEMNIPIVGASGAVYGILVAFGLLFPNAELMLIFLPIPIKAKYFIPVLMVIEFILGVNQYSWDNIAHFAHLGGALFGIILILFWTKNDQSYRIN
ncbi:MAG: rhomboid family intramembrane serine protease [Saprospiraceae bacterium]|nr:rhomboid family intramembrane serine protease [Saprospiraceae bacterium]